MKIIRLLILTLLLAFSLGIARPVQAAPPDLPSLQDEVCFGGTRTISEGTELDGSLVGFGCTFVIENDATVNGDVVLFGGTISIDGEVTGDLVAMGTSVTLDENSLVLGDMIAPGSSIFRQEGSEVEGQTITDSGTSGIDIPDIPAIPEIPDIPNITIVPQPVQPQNPFVSSVNFAVEQFTRILLSLFQSFAFAALAALLIIFIPKQTEKVADAMVAQPVVTGSVGFLTGIVGPIMLAVLTLITLFILSPLTILATLLLALALVFGWIAVGFEVGRRLTHSFEQTIALPLQAGIGTFVVSLAVAAIGIVWPLGVLAWILVASLGLGAVVMTRFGTQTYVGATGVLPADEEIEPEPEPEVKTKPKPRTRKKKTDE